MKRYMKYLISTVIFFIMYTLIEYLLIKTINFKMIIVTTIIYAVLYIIIDLICDKLLKK